MQLPSVKITLEIQSSEMMCRSEDIEEQKTAWIGDVAGARRRESGARGTVAVLSDGQRNGGNWLGTDQSLTCWEFDTLIAGLVANQELGKGLVRTD